MRFFPSVVNSLPRISVPHSEPQRPRVSRRMPLQPRSASLSERSLRDRRRRQRLDRRLARARPRHVSARSCREPRVATGGSALPTTPRSGTATAEFVALLNNDTRVAIRIGSAELVSAAQRHDAAAVASKILSWNGETIDFVGGVTSFIGHSWQRDFGEPATRSLRRKAAAVPPAADRRCSPARPSSMPAASTRTSSPTSRMSISAGG